MKTVVFTGGGTAGHITPNLALISALKGEVNCVYIGSDGMEKSLVTERGIRFYCTPAVKFRRDAFFRNLAIPFRLHSCVKSAKALLRDINPNLVFSKGGYAALPTVIAASKLDIPIYCHESDYSPGITTKLTARRAEKVLCAFPPCAKRFKNGVYAGTPLERTLFNRKKPQKSKPTLLIMGGSSGATAINNCATSAIRNLTARFDVIHITGKNKGGQISAPGYTAVEFCGDMGGLYAQADVAVTRAGANSLAELIALRVPCVAIPLEKASRGDQLQNAQYYSSAGAIRLLREKDMTPDALSRAATEVYEARSGYIAAMAGMSGIDGTEKICNMIREKLFSLTPR